jgi:tRNA-specific 2-thiouridylase
MGMENSKTVVVGLSGGVDSAVTAALLIEQGYRVTGVSLSLWKAGEPHSNFPEENYRDAQAVASHLKIPWFLVDMRESFRQKVVSYYLESLEKGLTPNPCIVCNKIVKWRSLMDAADQHAAACVATGHYARVKHAATYELHKAADLRKDQTYFLSVLGQPELSRTVLPLGDFTKDETRRIAKKKGIPVADRSESQDLCFLGVLDQNDFIDQYAPDLLKSGEIIHQDGRVLGEHRGLARYTVGQRKGIQIAQSSALYVLKKDILNNRLIVGEEELLGTSGLTAGSINWISGHAPSDAFSATVKIRYGAAGKEGFIKVREDGKLDVRFTAEVRDITPGQAMVMYQGEKCLGMGFIE